MSQEIQLDPSNHPHEHASQANSNPVPSYQPYIDGRDHIQYNQFAKACEERKKYLEIDLPKLYEASIRCDWKAAEAILDNNPHLVRFRISKNGDTALHIAASSKAPKKKVGEFVKNLVERMTPADLKLVNNNQSTALYLAAAAGNVEPVKIMMEANQEWMEKNQESMEKNPTLDTIPGCGRERLMPLYAAVLFGNKDVAEYLYKCSRELRNDGWDYKNRRSLLEKCVESDMFDIALKIMEAKWWLDSNKGTLLALLARKPEAFHKKQSSNTEFNIIRRAIKYDIVVQIVKKHQYLGKSINLLGLLARKLEAFHEKKSSNTESNEAFHETKSSNKESNEAFHEKKSSNTESNMIKRTVKSVFAFIGYKAEKNDALPLLRCIWGEIVKVLSKEKIDDILRGPPDSIKSGFGRIHQTMQLKALIFDRLDQLDKKAKEIKKQEGERQRQRQKQRQRERQKERERERQRQKEREREGKGMISFLAMAKERERQKERERKISFLPMVRERKGESVDVIFQKLKDLVYKHVVDMHVETQRLIKQENTINEDQALDLQKHISEFIVKLHDETRNMPANGDVSEYEGGDVFEYDGGDVFEYEGCDDFEYEGRPVQRLLNLIFDHIKKMRAEIKILADTRSYSSRVLFIAAEVGNTNFLIELIRARPDLIWQVDDNGLSIFHIAVKHRHEGIYNLLYEIGSMKDMVTPLTDNDGNNMLHLAAMRTRKKNLENVIGAALQMQRELLWFKEVERMVPPFLREKKNKYGLTPRQLFTSEHQYLIEQGEQWMKSTANQCMLVATLIATIVFAAAFTVPGGYDQNDGIPMFKQKLSFVAFVVADAISLSLSSASIFIFLSFYTSRYAEDDFVASSPMKLMSGLVTLFLSIGAMLVTFSVSFFVLYHKEMKWIPIFISLFAVIPAILYVALQRHLLVDIVTSTYGGKNLFKPTRQVLFYQNPRF